MLFFRKNWLRNINNKNFGEYLEFVESNVFEVEVVLNKYNESVKKNKMRMRLAYLRVTIFIFAFLCCPLILGYLSLSNSELSLSLYIELIGYILWVGFGIYLLKKAIFTIMNKNLTSKEELHNLKYALTGVLKYGQSVVDAFFDKKEEVKCDYFMSLDKKQLSKVQKGLNILEIDLTVFHDIARKSKKCNVKPLLIDELIFFERRDFSEDYIKNYYFYRIKNIK